MEPEVATGLFVLGRVLVGAVASTASQVYLEKKREEPEANRAKRLVAGELLHLQMVFRSLSAGTHWPFIEDVDAYLPNSAWQEHRSRLMDEVDEDLGDQLVMADALLVTDGARLVTAAKLDKPLDASEAASLRQTGYHLGDCADGSVTAEADGSTRSPRNTGSPSCSGSMGLAAMI